MEREGAWDTLTGRRRGMGEVERAILEGLQGEPELNREGRKRFLGELPDRVLASISKEEARQGHVHAEIAEAIRNRRAAAVVAHTDLPAEDTEKYRSLASQHRVPFTRRNDPSYTGDVGLIVVADPGPS